MPPQAGNSVGKIGAIVLLVAALCACVPGTSVTAPPRGGQAPDYPGVTAALERFIRHEMEDKELPALSIALVNDQEIVWAEGFGHADPGDSIPASAATVYRVGSISKLFTDVAIMQLVEQGEVDLDAPVEEYLPALEPGNPFGRAVTLRQLMAHRSGLVREPPVGNYFDPTEPTLAATVESLNRTELIYSPEQRIKYSNAAIAVVGYILEHLRAEPFPDYIRHQVLEPAGLHRSAFEPLPELAADLATAFMWTYDGRTFEAPTFQLGMAPAGSMYSTVADLARFLSVLFAGGEGVGGRVLQRRTLESMWTPQFTETSGDIDFGLGFGLSELDGMRRIGHGGAIYGFSSALVALPEQKLGAVVVTSMDMSNAVVERIAEAGIRLMLAAREGRPLPEVPTSSPVPDSLARRLAGRYTAGERSVEIVARPDGVYLTRGAGGVRSRLRMRGDTLIVDGRLAHGSTLLPIDERRIEFDGELFTRQPSRRPEPPPASWEGLIGEYGWDHNVLYILEKDGQLHSLIEWFFLDPLEEIESDVFRFPDRGLYPGEHLVFSRDASGRATTVEAAGVSFERRQVGLQPGETFRIEPVRPVEEIRPLAAAASPPEESGALRTPDLVDLASLDPTIGFDIRYATTNNFMGAVFYREPRAFLQRPAAEALLRAHQRLQEHGYGLLVHDAYRPWYVTWMFWEATPEELKHFVADPSRGSRHNRGAAVDVTLYNLRTGAPVQTVSGYDEFSPRAYPDYPGGTSLQRWYRELLRDAMEAEGFRVYEYEWWHFDYGDWRSYPILNLTFDRLTIGRRLPHWRVIRGTLRRKPRSGGQYGALVPPRSATVEAGYIRADRGCSG